jgi:hypothetical protein
MTWARILEIFMALGGEIKDVRCQDVIVRYLYYPGVIDVTLGISRTSQDIYLIFYLALHCP